MTVVKALPHGQMAALVSNNAPFDHVQLPPVLPRHDAPYGSPVQRLLVGFGADEA